MTTMDPYIKGRDLFVNWCKDTPSATPIEFGTIGCPGLSDIDIGMVFDKTFDPNNCDLRQMLLSFPEKTRELMNGGTLMFFPEDIFREILLIDDIQVQSLAGEIDTKEVTDREKYLVDLVQIIEWLPERISRIYLELQREEINHKSLTGAFYSLCYSLNKIQKHAGENKKLSRFVEEVYNLRSGWFSLDQNITDMALRELSQSYVDICSEAINSIAPILDAHFNVSKQTIGTSIGYNLCKNIHFVCNDHIDIGIFSFEDFNDSVFINLPSSFLCTYYEYSKHDSKLGSLITKRISIGDDSSVVISEEMTDILKRRVHIFSSLLDFVKAIGCETGLYKFGWYLNE